MISVLGVDPSLRATGVCLPNGQCFTIKTGESRRGSDRLVELRKAMRYYVREQAPDLAVVELPADFRSRDAVGAAWMAQAIVREALAAEAVPTGFLHPGRLKIFACGRGDADKADMVAACNRHRQVSYPFDDGQYAEITDDNQADAWWLRAAGRWRAGERNHLDPACDSFLNGDTIRDHAVNDPGKHGRGAEWPDLSERTPHPSPRRATPGRR